jgi:hypothetical protein
LRVTDASPPADAPPTDLSPAQRIERALAIATAPLGVRELRAACRIRSETLCATLDALTTAGRVLKSAAGYTLVG